MNLKKRILFFLTGLIATLVFFRLSLYLMPFRNFDVFGYNVHHVFTGILILMVPIVAFVFELKHWIFLFLAGIGSALVLDEVFYLIVTGGSDLEYLSPVSLYGSLFLIGLLTIIIAVLYFIKVKKS